MIWDYWGLDLETLTPGRGNLAVKVLGVFN